MFIIQYNYIILYKNIYYIRIMGGPNYVYNYAVWSYDFDYCDLKLHDATRLAISAPPQDASNASCLVSSVGPPGARRGRTRVWTYPARTSGLRSFIPCAMHIALAKATAEYPSFFRDMWSLLYLIHMRRVL